MIISLLENSYAAPTMACTRSPQKPAAGDAHASCKEGMMQSKLKAIYAEAFSRSVGSMATLSGLKKEYPTNPMLIDLPSDYLTADKKVMILGKETNDWGGKFPDSNGVSSLMEGYREFCNEGENWAYGGHYWNGVGKFKEAMEEHFRENGESTSFIYNNIIKIGKAWDKGAPSEPILEWESHWFHVVKREVELLKPNIMLFFTGPDYDVFISRAFGDFELKKISKKPVRHLARLVSPALPKNTIRTCHPRFLWTDGLYDYLKDIMKAIGS
jgi:hypothetical protein